MRRRFRLALVAEVEGIQVAVDLEERGFAHRVAQAPVAIERRARQLRRHRLDPARRIVGPERLALGLHRLRGRRQPPQPGIEVGERPALQPQRVERARQLCDVLVGQRLRQRSPEQLVHALIELRDHAHGLKRLLVGAFEAIQARGDVFQTQLGEAHLVPRFAARILLLGDFHPVQARRQRFDRIEHRYDLGVFLLRHLAGNEDAEMADVFVHQSDDHLSAGLDFLGAAVHVGDPVERLLRRGDVVARRGEQHDRDLDVAQVEDLARTGLHRARPQLVADEEVLRDPLDLLAIQQVVAAPPALELEEALRLGRRCWRTPGSTCPRTCWRGSGTRSSAPARRRRTSPRRDRR